MLPRFSLCIDLKSWGFFQMVLFFLRIGSQSVHVNPTKVYVLGLLNTTEYKPQCLDPDFFLANFTVKADLVLCTNCTRKSLV